MLDLPCRPSLKKNHDEPLEKAGTASGLCSWSEDQWKAVLHPCECGGGGFSDRGKQNRKHKFFQKKKAGEIWEYIEMNLFGSDTRVEMQYRCNSISVIEMFCTKRRSEEVPSTLMKPHYAEAAQQNRQKMPDLQPTHLPYCLITPVQVATAPKIKAP